jgi:hypothetical protein
MRLSLPSCAAALVIAVFALTPAARAAELLAYDMPVAQRLTLIQDFRHHAGLPALQPTALEALTASPEIAVRAQVEAAQAMLQRISPAFSTEITPQSEFLDSPGLLSIRRTVASARQTVAEARVSGLRDLLSDDVGVSPAALEHAYTGSKLLLSLTGPLQSISGDYIRDMIVDGAPRQALDAVERLRKRDPSLRRGQARRSVDLLSFGLKSEPESPAVIETARRIGEIKKLLSQGRYGDALADARGLGDSIMLTPLRGGTRSALWLEAALLQKKISARGMAALYGGRGLMSPAALARHGGTLAVKDPQSYSGDALTAKPVRIQCYSDCTVQQAYNHPQLSLLAEQLPYGTFLNAMESKLQQDIRHTGLWRIETGVALRELGLRSANVDTPRSAEGLVDLLRRHGAMMASIRFNPAKNVKDTRGNHAVLVQGAFREDGAWNFILIDSNHSRPQIFTFDELGLFGAAEYASVAPMANDDAELPDALRAIADPAARLRKAVNLFYGRFAAVREVVPWYKQLFFCPINLVRGLLGLAPLEPAPRRIIDDNLVPIDHPSRSLVAALSRGLKLPPEAVVTAPDGRRFLNRLVVERLLSGR